MTITDPAPMRSPGEAARPLSVKQISVQTWVRIIAGVLLAAAAAATPGFFSTANVLAVITTISFLGVIVITMTLITLSGNIMSFSLGATAAASAVVFMLSANATNPVVALIAAAVTGAVISGAQGLVIGAVRANPIIVSIAALTLVYGTLTAFTQNETIYGHLAPVRA